MREIRGTAHMEAAWHDGRCRSGQQSEFATARSSRGSEWRLSARFDAEARRGANRHQRDAAEAFAAGWLVAPADGVDVVAA
jgi:hypothetical protein